MPGMSTKQQEGLGGWNRVTRQEAERNEINVERGGCGAGVREGAEHHIGSGRAFSVGFLEGDVKISFIQFCQSSSSPMFFVSSLLCLLNVPQLSFSHYISLYPFFPWHFFYPKGRYEVEFSIPFSLLS